MCSVVNPQINLGGTMNTAGMTQEPTPAEFAAMAEKVAAVVSSFSPDELKARDARISASINGLVERRREWRQSLRAVD